MAGSRKRERKKKGKEEKRRKEKGKREGREKEERERKREEERKEKEEREGKKEAVLISPQVGPQLPLGSVPSAQGGSTSFGGAPSGIPRR